MRAIALATIAATLALAAPAAGRPLANGYVPPPFSQTIPGSGFASNPYGSGSGSVNGGTFQLNGYGCANATVTVPYDGMYTLSASLSFSGATGSAVVQAGYDNELFPASPSGQWSYLINSAGGAGTYAWSDFLKAGSHKLCIGLYNPSGAFTATQPFSGAVVINSATLSSPGYAPRPEPPTGSRKASIQPYSSYALWNTAIGSGATGLGSGNVEVQTLRTSTLSYNQPSYYGVGVFQASASDPVERVIMNRDYSFPVQSSYNPPNFFINLPANFQPSGPLDNSGDHHVTVYSPDKRIFYNMFGCQFLQADGVTVSYSNTNFGTMFCGQSEAEDALQGMGWNPHAWAAGIIRAEDVAAGVISHGLRFAISKNLVKPGTTNIAGIAWPAQRSDYCGPAAACSPLGFQQYTGGANGVLYGRTIYIPASVNLASLGLTANGLMVATALQNFGAHMRDTGGSSQTIFYVDQNVSAAFLNDVRADAAKIMAVMDILGNQAPATMNGGGTPRVATQAGALAQ